MQSSTSPSLDVDYCQDGLALPAAAKPQSRDSTPVPELYSASHIVSKLAKISALARPVECIRDFPVRAHGPYNEQDKSTPRMLDRTSSSNGAVLQASTWFDDVAASRMQQMHKAQENAVKGYNQELECGVQKLTDNLNQVI